MSEQHSNPESFSNTKALELAAEVAKLVGTSPGESRRNYGDGDTIVIKTDNGNYELGMHEQNDEFFGTIRWVAVRWLDLEPESQKQNALVRSRQLNIDENGKSQINQKKDGHYSTSPATKEELTHLLTTFSGSVKVLDANERRQIEELEEKAKGLEHQYALNNNDKGEAAQAKEKQPKKRHLKKVGKFLLRLVGNGPDNIMRGGGMSWE